MDTRGQVLVFPGTNTLKCVQHVALTAAMGLHLGNPATTPPRAGAGSGRGVTPVSATGGSAEAHGGPRGVTAGLGLALLSDVLPKLEAVACSERGRKASQRIGAQRTVSGREAARICTWGH